MYLNLSHLPRVGLTSSSHCNSCARTRRIHSRACVHPELSIIQRVMPHPQQTIWRAFTQGGCLNTLRFNNLPHVPIAKPLPPLGSKSELLRKTRQLLGD